MAKIDKLDRIIRDYVNGNLDKKIKARTNQLTYKSKVDNIDVNDAIDNDSELDKLYFIKSQIEVWYFSYPEAKTICELRWRKGMQQWEIKYEVKMSESTIKRRYKELKEVISEWIGIEEV
ncbi:DUF722 domain-containing protein [Lactococcus hircilactis]|uniref:DUF722 domain-containing protein n=1 Tax=Lactococcus hircilactis TaxID=1494462 RepID=A0A7X1ZB51_9LACT|nr:DUF722 domain-containing protein [Lactococcus hircilactis]